MTPRKNYELGKSIRTVDTYFFYQRYRSKNLESYNRSKKKKVKRSILSFFHLVS